MLSLLLSTFSEPFYCTDGPTEGLDELLAKINKKELNIQYFEGQVKETDRLFKEALRQNLPEDARKEALQAKKESEVNLNSERRFIKVLKNRLNSGNYDSSISTSSSLGKRNIDEDE